MARKPVEFSTHPIKYVTARDAGYHRAVVKHIVDADTFDVFMDLGFLQYVYMAIRLEGIDAPEIRGDDKERGYEAKERVTELLSNKPVLLKSVPDGVTFNRYAAFTFIPSSDFDLAGITPHMVGTQTWYNLADVLRKEGHEK